MNTGNYITFIELPPVTDKSRKTKVWEVATKRDKETNEETYNALGEIKWYGAWRRYAFFPEAKYTI